ncbi:MAG: type I-F CRISPR-associated endoribonuclease Cas6/Csy4 [Gammaproteobacteria bacterium]|nr:type I-F CRISPR-associated endoribonuclease Cas6/Csy4 [Gammaproteobacteria bacterium]
MNHYFNITLLPDAELKVQVLMNAIFAKLHKLLCDKQSTAIGVSFPQYAMTCLSDKSERLPSNFPQHYVSLGNTLRVHGTEAELAQLKAEDWLGGMSGYCKVGDIVSVPVDTKHRTVSRKQTTMSQAKLNRLLKRGSITEQEVKQYRAKMFNKGLDNPYLELTSGSNGQKHRRYIELGPLLDKPVEGRFDQFGLSKTATVPWF